MGLNNVSVSTKRKGSQGEEDLEKNWREVLGNPPKKADGLRAWVKFQKKKWAFQNRQRKMEERSGLV